MRQRLSNHRTRLFKFVFPALWAPLTGLMVIGLFAGVLETDDLFRPQVPAELVRPFTWFFLAAYVAGLVSVWRTIVPLKQVDLDGNRLVVSNFRHEISIPASEIASVSESRWALRAIRIHLRRPTRFGSVVTFIPADPFPPIWRSNPIVEKLRGLAVPGL